MDQKSPSRAILDRLSKAGVPKGAIAKRLVVAPSAVSALFAGDRQLKYDEGVKLLEMLPADTRGSELPLIGMAGAGAWLEAIEDTSRHIWAPPQISGKFAVEVVGDSMNLLLPEGSIAIVDPDDIEIYSGKIYLLRNDEGEATIKRYRADPARFEPVSDNPEYAPFAIGSFGFRVIGRITGGVQVF